MSTEFRRVEERFERLEAQCRQAREQSERAERRCRQLAGRLRVVCGLGAASLAVALFAAPATNAVAQGYGATLQSLIDKTRYIRVAGGEMFIEGANLHLRNGMGATETTNGLGNLVIGYNALRGGRDLRAGSHNLIAGDLNSYASYGGIVVGRANAILAPYASVSGGQQNTADHFHDSVSGGVQNTASAGGASVSGGFHNFAVGVRTSISGGANRVRQNPDSWQGGALSSGP